jgi:hypothetical protein
MIFNLKTQTYETTKKNYTTGHYFHWYWLFFMLILGLADLYYLRVFNVLFVFYGTDAEDELQRREDFVC